MLFKKVIRQIHLWLGLTSGLIVFIVAITGTIWTFESEISDVVYNYRMVEPQNKPFVSISKIKDRIQREIYVQECSRIMDISEQVLLNTLAQLAQKDIAEAGKKLKQENAAFEVVKRDETEISSEKVDVLYSLERKIIEILLLYGNETEEFEDVLLRTNELGEVENYSEKKEYKVYERIFLNLQEDEVELANPLFRNIYNDLMNFYHQNEVFAIESYLSQLQPEFSSEVSNFSTSFLNSISSPHLSAKNASRFSRETS